MKTTFKSIITIIVIIAMAVITTSCGNLFGLFIHEDVPSVTPPSEEFMAAANYVGEISRIIDMDNDAVVRRAANDDNDSEAYLVEYNLIKPELLNYIEQYEFNSRPLSSHDGVHFYDNKKYVEMAREFSETDQDYRILISVFSGSWKDTVGLCCTRCEFNTDFTYDCSHCIEVDFGEPFVSE